MLPAPGATKPLKHQPKIIQRRSKEEREAIERAESEKRHARADAAAAEEAAAAERQRQKYGISTYRNTEPSSRYQGNPVTYRMGRGGRGGFMGSTRIVPRNRPGGGGEGGGGKPGERPSGPSQGSAVTRDPKRSVANPVAAGKSLTEAESSATGASAGKASEKSGKSGASKQRGPRIKKEPEGGEYLGSSIEVKKEVEQYFFISDGEEGQDVDYIEISEDSANEQLVSDSDGDIRERRRRERMERMEAIPRRIQRQEHRDRVIGVNMDASTTGPQTNQPKTTEDGADATRRRKGKARMPIKPDPEEDAMEGLEGPAAAAQHVDLSEDEREGAVNPAEHDYAGPTIDSKADVVSKARRRPATRKPVFLTVEEKAEAERYEESMRTIQEEFGSVSFTPKSTAKPKAVEDAMDEDSIIDETLPQPANTDNVTYLFQFPPVLPDLHAKRVKKEVIDDDENGILSGNLNPTDDGIKIEDDDKSKPGLAPPSAGHGRRPHLEKGRVGKLRIHASGKMSLDWGGTSFCIAPGMSAHFLQTITQIRMNTEDLHYIRTGEKDTEKAKDKEALRDPKGDGFYVDDQGVRRAMELTDMTGRALDLEDGGFKGSMTSFGQVRGKLVVTPDWEEILG